MFRRGITPGYEVQHAPEQERDRQKAAPPWKESQPECLNRCISRRDFLISTGISAAFMLGGMSLARAQGNPTEKVGFLLPERGPHSLEARSLIAGFELFLKEKGGEVPPVEILKKDTGPEDEKTLDALADLLTNRDVRFLVGPLSAKGTEQTIHGVGSSNGILFVTNPAVRLVAGEMCLPGSFRLCVNTYQAAQPLASWAMKHIGRTAFLTGDDDAEGNEEADFFAYSFEKAGGSFADRIMLSDGAKGIKSVVGAVAAAKSDLVFASFKNASAVAFLKAARTSAHAVKPHIIGPQSLTGFPHPLSELGEAATGVKTLTPLKDAAGFAQKIKRQVGTEVADVAKAAEGYDIAAAICRALSGNAGETDLSKIIKAVEEIEIVGPRGKVRFDKNHEPLLEMSVQEWQRSGQSFKQKIVESLGICQTPDFGCGRVGFPRKPEAEVPDEEPAQREKGD